MDGQADRQGNRGLASPDQLGPEAVNKLKALEPAAPIRLYERPHPGEMIHIDINKLGRFEQCGHRIGKAERFIQSAKQPS